MKSKHSNNSFKNPESICLSKILNPRHELYILAQIIDWQEFEESFGSLYSENGRPPKPTRLMVGLLMLQHMYDLSDERVVLHWTENPYWQFFCGFEVLQWQFPIDPSSLTRFRNRIGKEGMEKILSATIKLALNEQIVAVRNLKDVIVDTTVMEKNICHPTDARLYFRLRERFVNWLERKGLF